MNTMYNDFFHILEQAIEYPNQFCKLIRNQIKELSEKVNNEKQENILSFFQESNDMLANNILVEGARYFEDKDVIKKSLGKVVEFCESFEELTIESQTKERFYPQPGDSLLLKIEKAPKRLIQNIIWLVPKIKNLYNKLRKKPIHELYYKKHKVKKRKLAQLVFINYFLKESYVLYEETLELRQELLLQLRQIVKEFSENLLLNFDTNEAKTNTKIALVENKLNDHLTRLRLNIDTQEKELRIEFDELQLKFGTFEFPARRTNDRKIKSQQEKHIKKYTKLLSGCQLSYNSLAAYNEYLTVIYRFLISSSLTFIHAGQQIKKGIVENIESSFTPFHTELANWIAKNEGKTEFVLSELSENILGKHIPDFTNSVLQIDLNTIIDIAEQQINSELNQIQTNLTIPKWANYKKPITKKQIKNVSTKIIIQKEFKQNIENKLLRKRQELTEQLQLFLRKMNEITQILAFSLEYLETQHQEEKDDIATEFYNGIKRAFSRSELVFGLIKKAENKINPDLTEINSNFIESLSEAVEPATILRTIKKQQINHQVEQVRKSLSIYFKHSFEMAEKAWQTSKKAFFFARKNYLNLRVIFGIGEAAKSISNELSNYLSETEATINSLPLMYQKLFKPEALTKERLYIPRQKENYELEAAFNAWLNKKYAPTCIVGETGIGTTTTINFFEKKMMEKLPVVRFVLEKQITDVEGFLALIKQLFKDLNIRTPDDLIDQLENIQNKQVVIIENIHYLYGRYNNGFVNITAFLHLISKTNTSIYWLCSAKQHSWDFLNYSIDMADYFGYIVQMNGLDKEQIIKTIDDRHIPSGYSIKFVERESYKRTRKYKSSSEITRQNMLRNDFFNLLYKNTKGNIKLALLFWKMAVIKMENDVFYFQLKEIDHSFLESLGVQKLATLHNILIHDGLSVAEYSKVFGISIKQSSSQLTILENDAVIVLQKDQYQINPLLYKHVVDHLKAINFIY